MDIINLLGSSWPTDNVWANIIKIFDIGSYAWTIILFTVILKLVLSPMDFLQRFYTNKTSRAQAKLQPQLAKLQKQYGQNQTLLYQKQNELYRKSGFSMKGSCTVMLLYLVLTLFIFISLFNSMQYIASYKIKVQYEDLKQTYNQTYYSTYLPSIGGSLEEYLNKENNEQREIYIKDLESTLQENEVEEKKQSSISTAQNEVVNKYLQIKDSWLWIKNIWIADKATNKEILDYSSYISLTKDSESEENYNLVMNNLLNSESFSKSVNGYYILPILVVLVSFLSQWISRKMLQSKNSQNVSQPGFAKIMMFLLPFTMLIFTLNSSAIFSIYILTNSLISTLITPIITIICNKIEDKKEIQIKEINKVDYRR